MKALFSYKPSGHPDVVFTPERKPFNRSISSEYIVNGRYSGVASNKRKQHLTNKRGWNSMYAGLLPEIANIYDQTLK
jgi:hypothetical protein